LCLTTSPVITISPVGRITAATDARAPGAPAVPMDLAHVLTDAGFLLCRYMRPAD
jgi:hypothetical protein